MAKKSKKEIKEERLLIQRDYRNMLLQALPALIEQPMFQALVWWQVSKRNRALDFTNKLIVANDLSGLVEVGFEAKGIGGQIDIEPATLPEGVRLGAIIQEVEDSIEFADWTKDKLKAGIEKAQEEYAEGKDWLDKFLSSIGAGWEEFAENGETGYGGIG